MMGGIIRHSLLNFCPGLLINQVGMSETPALNLISCTQGSIGKNLMERYFALKISFLIFRRTKKFSTESFLTFRELKPLVSYERVSYKKKRVFFDPSQG